MNTNYEVRNIQVTHPSDQETFASFITWNLSTSLLSKNRALLKSIVS